jgi:1,4-dihydroxy-2-naphthoate octaprenyltransferase
MSSTSATSSIIAGVLMAGSVFYMERDVKLALLILVGQFAVSYVVLMLQALITLFRDGKILSYESQLNSGFITAFILSGLVYSTTKNIKLSLIILAISCMVPIINIIKLNDAKKKEQIKQIKQ